MNLHLTCLTKIDFGEFQEKRNEKQVTDEEDTFYGSNLFNYLLKIVFNCFLPSLAKHLYARSEGEKECYQHTHHLPG